MLNSASKTTLVVAVLAQLAALAPTTARAVEGAFGLRFDEPIATERLGASSDASLLNSLFGDQAEAQQQQSQGTWHVFAPDALPLRLKDKTSSVTVQVTAEGNPAWIAARFSSKDCSEDLLWLRDVLRKKYDQPDLSIRDASAPSALQEHFSKRLLFEVNTVKVSAGCGILSDSQHQLQVEYWDRSSGVILEQAKKAQNELTQALASQRTAAAERLGKLRGRAVASTVASGSRYKIEQVFGLPLERAVKAPGNFVVDEFVDYPLEGVSPPYRGQVARVQLGPSGHLIRFELKIPDNQAVEFKRLQQALRQQFEPPTKATRKHVIFRVGQDFLVLRRRLEQLEFTLISGAGEKGLKSRQLAAQEKQWQAENAGI